MGDVVAEQDGYTLTVAGVEKVGGKVRVTLASMMQTATVELRASARVRIVPSAP